MAYKCREELVGKRFLSVSTFARLKLSQIKDWNWKRGIIRAASHHDLKNPELTILVEFDDRDWKKREWITLQDQKEFQVFLIEHTLVWCTRKETPVGNNLEWPAFSYQSLVDRVGLDSSEEKKPIEYLLDNTLDFVDYKSLKNHQDAYLDSQRACLEQPELVKAIKRWSEFQDGQKILLTTPSVLVGYRVKVYRSQGTTQWYTAVIVSYNQATKELTLTDDTVLEEHSEDPALVQINLIGDGVVESILRGEELGITPRRRLTTNYGPRSHRSLNNNSSTSSSSSSSTNHSSAASSSSVTNHRTPTPTTAGTTPSGTRTTSESRTIKSPINSSSNPPTSLGPTREFTPATLNEFNSKSTDKEDRNVTNSVPKKKSASSRKSASPVEIKDPPFPATTAPPSSLPPPPVPPTTTSSQTHSSGRNNENKEAMKMCKEATNLHIPQSSSANTATVNTKNNSGSSNSSSSSGLVNGNHIQIAGTSTIESPGFRAPLLPGHPLIPKFNPPSLAYESLMWQQKYPPGCSLPPNPWMFHTLQQQAFQEEQHKLRMEKEKKDEKERLEREKEKEREKERERERQRLEKEEKERKQREAVRQHFEESLRRANQKRVAEGYDPHPLAKLMNPQLGLHSIPMSSSSVTHLSVKQSSSNDKEKSSRDTQHRFQQQLQHHHQHLQQQQHQHSVSLHQKQHPSQQHLPQHVQLSHHSSNHQLHQHHQQQLHHQQQQQQHQQQQQNQQHNDLRYSRHSDKIVPPGPYMEQTPVLRYSNHSKSNHSRLDGAHQSGGVAGENFLRKTSQSPVTSQNNENAAKMAQSQQQQRANPELAFSLYGYQPFQHSYISASQLKENSAKMSSSSSTPGGVGPPSIHNSNNSAPSFVTPMIPQASVMRNARITPNPFMGEKRESSPLSDRSLTPGNNSRNPTPIGRPPSLSPKNSHQQQQHKGSSQQERVSPHIYPHPSSHGSFKPYEASGGTGPQLSAPPAHQSSSPGLNYNHPGSAAHARNLSQDQPQNLVKSEVKSRQQSPQQPPSSVPPPTSQQNSATARQQLLHQHLQDSHQSAVDKYSVPQQRTSNSPSAYNLMHQALISSGSTTTSTAAVPTSCINLTSTSHNSNANGSRGNFTNLLSSQLPPPMLGNNPTSTGGGVSRNVLYCRPGSIPPPQQQPPPPTTTNHFDRQARSNFSPNHQQIQGQQQPHQVMYNNVGNPRTTVMGHDAFRLHSGLTQPDPNMKKASQTDSYRIQAQHTQRIISAPVQSPYGPPPGRSLPPNAQSNVTLFTEPPAAHGGSSNLSGNGIFDPNTAANKRCSPTDLNVAKKMKRERTPSKDDKAGIDSSLGQHQVTGTVVAAREKIEESKQISSSPFSSSQQNSTILPTPTSQTITIANSLHNNGVDTKALPLPTAPPKLEMEKESDSVGSGLSGQESETKQVAIISSLNNSNTTSSSSSNTTASISSSTTEGSTASKFHPKLKKAWLQRHSDEDKIDNNKPSETNSTSDSNPNPTVVPGLPLPQPPKPSSSASSSDASSTLINTVNVKEEYSKETATPSSEEEKRSNGFSGSPTKAVDLRDEDETSSASESDKEPMEKNSTGKHRVERATPRKRMLSSVKERDSKKHKNSNNSGSSGEHHGDERSKEERKKKGREKEKEKEKEKDSKTSQKRGRKPKMSKKEGRENRDTGSGSSRRRSSGGGKLSEKPSLALLKKTGQPFLQNGPCSDVAPKLPRCRECKPTQRNKRMPNIFCRFYAYRKVRFNKSAVITSAGFSEPGDADENDLKLWLPPEDPCEDLTQEQSKFLITHVGDQFCDLVKQEKEALKLHVGDDKPLTWKRVVQGVREMCDVCETTLFNIHWVCQKCGFVVCIDCYKARKENTITEESSPQKERDKYQWLLCANRQPHEQDKLMMTQIVAKSALWEVGEMLHKVRKYWKISSNCSCVAGRKDSIKGPNGISQHLITAVNKCFKEKDDQLLNGIKDGKKKGSVGPPNGVSLVLKADSENSTLTGYSSESGSSPLSWLADVALNSSRGLAENNNKISASDKDEKEEKDGLKDVLDDKSGAVDDASFSTLRELLIRPTNKNGKELKASDINTVKKLAEDGNLEEYLSQMIKSEYVEKPKEMVLTYYTPRYVPVRNANGQTPRICSLEQTKKLYPDVPHTWYCSGRLLSLTDPKNKTNLALFQVQWERGQPVVVTNLHKSFDLTLWNAEEFSRSLGDTKHDLVNCKTGNVLPKTSMKKFWDGFENLNKRIKDEDGDHMLLKLKDWPPGDDFCDLLPDHFNDLMKCLPLSDYTHRNGALNLAGRLPECFVRPDLGPKTYIAYGSPLHPDKGTTNLHIDICDAVNVMMYAGSPKGVKGEDYQQKMIKALEDGGCDELMIKRVKEKGVKVGALWHIYGARDADKIRDLLNKVAKESGETLESHHDPIHDQRWYLDENLRKRLLAEYDVEGYSIAQCLGDAIFIPAGAPHQVRNLQSCIKVADDFVSPENVSQCFNLTQEFRQLSDHHMNREDKLQIKNIIYHTVKDAVASLRSKDAKENYRDRSSGNKD